MSHPTEPDPGSYDRDAIIAAVTDFYQFLARLPYIEPAEVLYPPPSSGSDGSLPGSWPHITSETFGALGKSAEVIALLQRLPYIRMDGEQEYVVAPETFPCDYRRDYFRAPALTAEGDGGGPWDVPGGFEFPSWVVPLTYGKNHGDYLMLDTTDGE